ncbi:MAG: metallophosphoesterase family protein [Anaerolineae bacterium]|nr:metallophosphoesterase family protein [Anaerolineae bacterium]
MRYLVLSDVHANLTAFEAVLKDAGKLGTDYEFIWCLGDIVGYGPDPNDCVDLLRSMPHLCLAGNHDWAALGRLDIRTFNADARKAVLWTRDHLSDENLAYLDALPTTFVLGEFTLVHGSPRGPIWEYILDPLVAALNFPHYQTPYCLVGHTHTPSIFKQLDDKGGCDIIAPTYGETIQLDQHHQIINPGSVGQPRDSDPRAAYAMLDIENLTWEFRRVTYDIKSVQGRMREAAMPERLINRLDHGW